MIKRGDKAIAAFKAHKACQPLEGQNLLFSDGNEGPIRDLNLYRSNKQLLAEAGSLAIRFHDLRHTTVSLMLTDGVPVIIVLRRLGHAKPSITMDVDGHIIPSRQEEAATMTVSFMAV